MTLKGRNSSIDDVHRINAVATKAPFVMYATTSTSCQDCRSFVGLFPMIGEEVSITAGDGVDPKLFEKLFKQMKI